MSSRHDGVSCDACNRNNFRLRRYKCLICYDYDLCGNCYDNGRATSSHSQTHPMQCILTQADFDLFYSGDSDKHIGSFTCPLCGQLGLSKSKLLLHVIQEHKDTEKEVICPLCSSLPDGVPNRQTIHFARHLETDHSGSDSSSSEQSTRKYGTGNISSATTAAQLRQNRHRPGIAPGRPPVATGLPGSSSATASRLSRADTSQNTIDLTGDREQQTLQAVLRSCGREEAFADTDRIAELISQINSIRSRATIRNQLASLEVQLENARAKLEERMQASLSRTTSTNSNPQTAGHIRTIRSSQERPTNPLLYHLLPVDYDPTSNSRALRIRNIHDDDEEDSDEDEDEVDEDDRALRDALNEGQTVDETAPNSSLKLPPTSYSLAVGSGIGSGASIVGGQKQAGKCASSDDSAQVSRSDCYVIGWDEGMFRQKDPAEEGSSLMSDLIGERHSASNECELYGSSYHHNQFLFLQEILTSSFSTNHSVAAYSTHHNIDELTTSVNDKSPLRLATTTDPISARHINRLNVSPNGDSVPPHKPGSDHQMTNPYRVPEACNYDAEPSGPLRSELTSSHTASLPTSDAKSSLLSQSVSGDVAFKESTKSRSALNNNDRV